MEPISQVQIPENKWSIASFIIFLFFKMTVKRNTLYNTTLIIRLIDKYVVQRSIEKWNKLCSVTRILLHLWAIIRTNWFSQAAWYSHNSSLNRRVFTLFHTSDSYKSTQTSKSLKYNSREKEKSKKFYLLFPIKHVPVCPCQTAPEATWNIEIHCSSNVEIQYVSWMNTVSTRW